MIPASPLLATYQPLPDQPLQMMATIVDDDFTQEHSMQLSYPTQPNQTIQPNDFLPALSRSPWPNPVLPNHPPTNMTPKSSHIRRDQTSIGQCANQPTMPTVRSIRGHLRARCCTAEAQHHATRAKTPGPRPENARALVHARFLAPRRRGSARPKQRRPAPRRAPIKAGGRRGFWPQCVPQQSAASASTSLGPDAATILRR